MHEYVLVLVLVLVLVIVIVIVIDHSIVIRRPVGRQSNLRLPRRVASVRSVWHAGPGTDVLP
ncbi:MAG: hypothetical protein FJY92_02785 [Candidatus Hydrogenedentes bacterium]|nr:hypothetical protein [Candidatus Hydrogenedentota bacterium]